MAAEGVLGRHFDGEVRTFPRDPSDGQPSVIVPGPGEAMWFTESRGDRIGRIAGEGDAA